MDERSVTIRPKERPAVFMRACARSPRYTIPYFFVTANLKTQRKYRARLGSFLSFSESAGFGGVLSIPLISKAANSWAGRAKPTEKEMNFVRVSCHNRLPRFAKKVIRPRHDDRIGCNALRRGPPMSIQSAHEGYAVGRVVLLSVATVVLLIFGWTFIN